MSERLSGCLHGFVEDQNLQRFKDDHELIQAIQDLADPISALILSDQQMADWLDRTVKPSPDRLKRDLKSLRPLEIGHLARQSLSLPEWSYHPDYHAFLTQSSAALAAFLQTADQIITRLEMLRKPEVDLMSESHERQMRRNFHYLQIIMEEGLSSALPEIAGLLQAASQDPRDYWLWPMDERVNELSDVSDTLFPRQAIRLLQRALSYRPQGVQAYEVYFRLGMRHEELGDENRAIDYYSKAMEVIPPSALVLFYRGQLFFRKKRYKEARQDLEAALQTNSLHEGRLDSAEREKAEALLEEMGRA